MLVVYRMLRCLAPLNLSREAAWDRVFAQLEVEQNSDDNEEAKKYDLDKKANNDNALASLHTVKASATLNAATWIKVSIILFTAG